LRSEFLKRRNSSGDLVSLTFAHLDPRAFGIACGIVLAIGVFLATAILLIRNQQPVGPNLALLGQYFLGYHVTWAGSVIGGLYGFLLGFTGAYAVAAIRNFLANMYLFWLCRRIEDSSDELP
jgi:hypothetical protein